MRCLVHQHDHAVDEPAQVVVELVDVVRDEAQRGIAVLANLSEREPTPSLALRLLGGVLVVLVVVLMVVLVIVIVRHRRPV